MAHDDAEICHLLRLPPELHLHIFDYVLGDSPCIIANARLNNTICTTLQTGDSITAQDTALALASTSRHFHGLLRSELYKRTTLEIIVATDHLTDGRSPVLADPVQYDILTLPVKALQLTVEVTRHDLDDSVVKSLGQLAVMLEAHNHPPAFGLIIMDGFDGLERDAGNVMLPALVELPIQPDAEVRWQNISGNAIDQDHGPSRHVWKDLLKLHEAANP